MYWMVRNNTFIVCSPEEKTSDNQYRITATLHTSLQPSHTHTQTLLFVLLWFFKGCCCLVVFLSTRHMVLLQWHYYLIWRLEQTHCSYSFTAPALEGGREGEREVKRCYVAVPGADLCQNSKIFVFLQTL